MILTARPAQCICPPELRQRPKVLHQRAPQERFATPISRLLFDAAEAFCVTVADILGRRRSKRIADARAVVAWVIRDTWAFSYPEVGAMLGRDHTTIMSACEKVRAAIAAGSELGNVACRLRGGDEAVLP